MKPVSIVFSLMLALSSQAAVWVHDESKSWNADWQSKYANWVASEVTPTYFKDLGKPFSNLRMDCADTHYALVAYFAARHGLPFRVNLGAVTNLTDRFDHLPAGNARLAAFINFLRANYGTESLSHRDTYPVAVNRLMPGDLFMYKVGSDGNYTRHTYIIKNINPDGTFDVLYSTQAIAAVNGSLKRNRSYMFNKAPTNKGVDHRFWGFRRMKLPQQAALDQRDVPGANFEQYDRALSLSAGEFFRWVKKVNQKVAESPQMLMQRHFTGVCNSVTERIEVVQKAVDHLRATGGACMTFQDFDAHSTPSRDSGLMLEYENYQADLDELRSAAKLAAVREDLRLNSETIFLRQRSERDRLKLYSGCPVNFGRSAEMKTDLGTFRDALFDREVSFHPNDNIHRRWGFAVGSRTSCKAFYGYPTE